VNERTGKQEEHGFEERVSDDVVDRERGVEAEQGEEDVRQLVDGAVRYERFDV
jgi:hypothetical protein